MAKLTVITGSARSSRGAEIDRRFVAAAEGALLLVPSRADARRRQESVLAAGGLCGLWGEPILDLAGFAEQIVAEPGDSVRRLSKLERRLLLESAVYTHRAALSDWLGVDPVTMPGFTSHLLAIIMQLKQAGIEPQGFREKLEKQGQLQPLDEAVACAYEGYQELLKQAGVYDVPGLYWAAEARCQAAVPGVLRGKRLVLLDAFDDFTPSELRLLHAVAECVPELVIGLHHDIRPARRDAYEAPGRGLARLRAVFEHRLETMDCDEPSPSDAVGFVGEHLFWRDTPPAAPPAADTLAILPCIDARHEAESVARRVRVLLEEGVPARGIALALRDTGAPLELLLAAMRQCGVPCKTNLRVPLPATSVGAALLHFFGMLSKWDRESVLDLLCSPVIWPATDARLRDSFGLLVRKAAILAGEREWDGQLTRLAAVLDGDSRRAEIIRSRVPEAGAALKELRARLATLRAWAKKFPAEADARDYVRATGAVFAAWNRGAITGEQGQAIWSTLQCLERYTPEGRVVSLGDYAAMLGRALLEAECAVGGDPAGVYIAAPESLRNQAWEHLFVIGVNEGVYPRPSALNALYTRNDLRRFEKAELHLEGSDMHAARERLLFLRLLLDARGGVTLSYRLKKEGDREAMPSPFLTEIEELLGSHSGVRAPMPSAEAIVPAPGEAAGLRDASNCAARHGGAALRVLAERQPAVARGLMIEQERWREAPCGPHDGVLTAAPALAVLSQDFGAGHVFSVSQLETWLGCPFQFFQERVLRLDESTPFEGEFDSRDRGSLLHAVLARFHARHRGAPLGSVDGETARAWMEEDTRAVFGALGSRGNALPEEAIAAERHYLGGLLRRYLAHAFEEDTGEWRPKDFELGFGKVPPADEEVDGAAGGMERHGPYALVLAGGEEVLLAGRIDRVDLSEEGGRARVIDYKLSKAPDAADIYGGRAMQLTVYAWALSESLLPGTSCAQGYYAPVGRGDWREALGYAPKQKKEAWAEREANTRLMIQQAVAGIREGIFPPLPADKACFGCAQAKACRRSESRQMRKVIIS